MKSNLWIYFTFRTGLPHYSVDTIVPSVLIIGAQSARGWLVLKGDNRMSNPDPKHDPDNVRTDDHPKSDVDTRLARRAVETQDEILELMVNDILAMLRPAHQAEICGPNTIDDANEIFSELERRIGKRVMEERDKVLDRMGIAPTWED